MSFRFRAMIMGSFILSLAVGAGDSMAVAQQGDGDQGSTASPPMSMVPGTGTSAAADASAIPKEVLVKQMDLKDYEAAIGGPSLCTGDKYCLKFVKSIKSDLCVAAVCDGTDNSKEPVACLDGLDNKLPVKTLDQINQIICPLVKSPDPDKRHAALSLVAGLGTEDDLVENGAYMMALKGSAESCQDYIKAYVGPYGFQWGYKWYRAMSGCRILAHKRTRDQEEKDFATWFGVVQGFGKCSDIVNSEMSKACSAPDAASPARPPG